MPFELLVTALLSAVGGGATVVAAIAWSTDWFAKIWAARIAHTQKLLGEIDLDLRKQRIAAYTDIWKATSILPKWPREPNVTYAQLLELSRTLRDWYFSGNGMYLSRSTHDKSYSALQDALTEVLRNQPDGRITEAHYDRIRECCSALRTALASDIESRREGPE